jgi:hypothetical protein
MKRARWGRLSQAQTSATRIVLTVGAAEGGVAQSYRIRVQNEGGRRVIAVRGADAAGAMCSRFGASIRSRRW